jgi:hypothetical protein
MKKIIFYSLFLVMFATDILLAQPGDPGEDPFEQIPISGGAILLILAAFGIGIKNIVKKKK